VIVDHRMLATPQGTARLEQHRATSPWATLALTHGAGGGVDATELQLLARELPPLGVTVSLVEQPWKVAGRRIAGRPASLDEGFFAVVSELRPRTPLVVGGRSAGARVACRTGRELGAVGVLALAFPLHPVDVPERSRAEELGRSRLPLLVLQGTRDRFGTPAEFPRGTAVVPVHDADHAFSVPKRSGTTVYEVERLIVEAVMTWLRGLLRHR
jgi:predicted alpha/beta-hydrolase family hydrolase